jgi:hypothetical protein
MSQQINILTLTANTPAQIFYCDSVSANCQYVSTISVVPFSFDVPAPYSNQDFIIKIIDNTGCTVGEMVYITPTQTPGTTPTQTPTQTQNSTPIPTNTPTQTNTGTPRATMTTTPTNTPTNTTTPVISIHAIGQNTYTSSGSACLDSITSTNYYTYISQANLIPVNGVTIYTLSSNGVLYNPFNGNNRWIKMRWGNSFYSVQINGVGIITNFVFCG